MWEAGDVVILLYCYCVQFGGFCTVKKKINVDILESSQRGSNENDKRFRKLEL